MKIVPDSIFVGDLPSKITDEELVNAFSQYGPITSLKLNRPGITGLAHQPVYNLSVQRVQQQLCRTLMTL